MDRYQYLLTMAACLLLTLPLELVLGARVYQRPRRVVRVLVPVAAVFLAWDAAAIAREHWDFSARYTTGVLLPFDVPLEEVTFFVVVPLCALLTFEAVTAMLGGQPRGRPRREDGVAERPAHPVRERG